MPPSVSRKRLRGGSPARKRRSSKKGGGKADAEKSRKPTLFDDLDAASSPLKRGATRLRHLQKIDDADSQSSLSSLSDADFEDVHIAKKPRPSEPPSDQEEDDEDVLFEDVPTSHFADTHEAPAPSGDLELTLVRDPRVSLTNPFGDKKGPSKWERLTRNAIHCVHVQSLMWHNAVRNSWLCDPELQGIMLSHLPGHLCDEVDRWRRNSGLDVVEAQKMVPSAQSRSTRSKKENDKHSRDWGGAASKLEIGAIDMSHGDPLFRLIKVLSAWWKKRFKITAPGIRRVGYLSLERLDRLMAAFASHEHQPRRLGERVADLQSLRELAQRCTGSRDVGAQLFTALLRGLGLEARMVANLQPLGFGWSKMEEADAEKAEKTSEAPKRSGGAASASTRQPARSKTKQAPAPGSGDDSDFDLAEVNSDNDSAIQTPQPAPAVAESYDRDLVFPHYWTEVLSPVTNKYLAVDAMLKSVLGTNRDLIESLEPRGVKADLARQRMAYVVGFSPDGTAKDVTVRYLRRQVLPGRTKGARMLVEKIPVYDKHGDVKRYDEFDWFRSVMRSYVRGSRHCPLTEVDDEEELTDLMPQTGEAKEAKESLQYYKQSQEFVLARHLKREEALPRDVQAVKVFASKGKAEENVYLRKDVVSVKSADTWLRQGREPAPGEEPLKRVPYIAATINRRRQIASAQAETGEKVLQPLYSYEQTRWIIPPPIEDGVIPKNEFGNINLFAKHMCPRGAVHIRHGGTVRVCKRLGIDFAEAVVGFEFGYRMAVPVIEGVVVAEEHGRQVLAELAKDIEARDKKKAEKAQAAARAAWRDMLVGLRIAKRMRDEYGDGGGEETVFGRRRISGTVAAAAPAAAPADADTAGGFFRDGSEEGQADDEPADQTSSFFPGDDDDDDDGDDALVVEDEGASRPTPRTDAASRSAGARGRP